MASTPGHPPTDRPGARRLVALFADDAEAEAAVRGLVDAGIEPGAIRVGDERDRIGALQGEMRAEVGGAGRTTTRPTKESARGAGAGTLVFGAVGAVLALPLALLLFGSLPLGAGLLAAALVGAAAGSTVGFILGGAETEKGAEREPAAERGVTVGVRHEPATEAVLGSADVLRLDVVDADGQPLASLRQTPAGGMRADAARAWREGDRAPLAHHPDRGRPA